MVLGLGAAALLILLLLPAPHIVAISLEVPEVGVPGQLLVVTAEVVNEGSAAGEQELTLLVDGDPVQTRTASLEPEVQDTVTFRLTDLRPGTYVVTLAELEGVEGQLWVVNRPTLSAPSRIVAGEPVQVELRISNAGSVTVSQEVGVAVDGAPSAGRILRLQPGAEETLTFTLTDLGPGRHQLTAMVGEWQGRSTELRVLRPASFSVSGLQVLPDPMDVNDSSELTVVATIANRGDIEGTYPLQVELDGTTVEERDLDLAGSTELEETIVLTVPDPGTHEVRLGDLTVSFVAYRLDRPGNGTVLTNQIGGGSNRLQITNNFDADVVVLLAAASDPGPALMSVYVRGGSSHTVRGIRDGTYATYYTFGADWCTHHLLFTDGATFGRFEGVDEYHSTGAYYWQVDIEFGVEDAPTGQTSDVPAEEFPTP